MAQSKLSPWVHFFLWGAVGVSVVLTVLNMFGAYQQGALTPLYMTLRILTDLIYIAVGIYTIVAFYARRPNAVALAWTFITLVIINLIGYIMMICFEYDGYLLYLIINCVVWLLFWGSLMLLGRQIRVHFPKEERRWFLSERIMLAVYILAFGVYLAGVCSSLRDPLNNSFYTVEVRTQEALHKLQKSSPTYTHGLAYDTYTTEGDTVCCETHYTTLSADKTDSAMLAAYCVAERQRTLWHYAHLRYRGQEKAYSFFNQHGFYLKTVLRDENKRFIGTILVSPDEYAAAHEAGTRFRCDTGAWKRIIDCENRRLPHEVLLLCSLQRIYLNDTCLCYDIEIPDYEPVLADYFSEPIMTGNLKKELWGLDGPCLIMADIDGRDVLFRALYRSGKEHSHYVFPNTLIYRIHHPLED